MTWKHDGFQIKIKLELQIPHEWATFLKRVAVDHYDYKCRDAGQQGVINALVNCSHPDHSTCMYPVSWGDLDLITKVMEQAHYHTKDYALLSVIQLWILEAKGLLEQHLLKVGELGKASS